MPDSDGYPTSEELHLITKWPYQDCQGLLEYVADLWRYPDYIEEIEDSGNEDYQENHIWHVSTGGWSGNEDIIGAITDNTMFWSICWYSSRRGGHYVFHVPRNLRGRSNA